MGRIAIPDELAAQVLFMSDRTCCNCRVSGRAVEIHHIDGNPSNNTIENLAVLCKDCHSDAHTTRAFARNLTSQLIRMYNESWRDIVRARLQPAGIESDALEYRLHVLSELRFLPFQWRNAYLSRVDDATSYDPGWESEPWDSFPLKFGQQYSLAEWARFKGLFESGIPDTIERLESLMASFGDAVSSKIKTRVFLTVRSLRMERLAYLSLPTSFTNEELELESVYFVRRFQDVLRSLMALTKLAEAEADGLRPFEETRIFVSAADVVVAGHVE